jgi:peptidoglycan/xylan/chitin deacetylase (PgdA/CDA1 family)
MKLRLITFSIFFISGLLFGQTIRAGDSAVVFMYHRFGEDRYPSTSIRVDQFRQQMEYLRDGGFTVIPLEELLDFLSGRNQALPAKAVVITVDDAYRSIYEVAYPLLAEYGFPFTVFVSTDPVDGKLPNYLNWDQIREMASNGVTFANHGAAHIYMVERQPDEPETRWQQRIGADIDKGWRRLTEELTGANKPFPSVFAYPYGEYDTGTAQQLTERGYIAFGQQSGAIGKLSDRRILPRFPMAEAFAGMDGFRTKALSLPMPVTEVVPWDPVTDDPLPEITITLAESPARLGQLACFVGGQGKVEVSWVESNRRFAVRPIKALAKGRQRVNCTAPRNDGRYYWFSHQWIVR